MDTVTGKARLRSGSKNLVQHNLGGVGVAIKLQDDPSYPLIPQVASYRGEQTVFPSPDDELLDGGVMEAMDLKAQRESRHKSSCHSVRHIHHNQSNQGEFHKSVAQ